jgi:hypothetical protein
LKQLSDKIPPMLLAINKIDLEANLAALAEEIQE